jgi:hypothetical protein
MDLVEQLAAWTEGRLTEDETVALFQQLVDTGQAWNLDGHTARMATAYIMAGHVVVTDDARQAYREVVARRGW